MSDNMDCLFLDSRFGTLQVSYSIDKKQIPLQSHLIDCF